MSLTKSLAVLAALAALAAPLPAVAAPQIGWWWNASESGRGFFIESHDGIFYLAAYLYGEDGHANWLVSGGSNADPYRYEGRLLAYANGQSLFGPYLAPTSPSDAGAISVQFADDTHGTITWPGGTVAIQREIFDPSTAVFQPESGWWWNSDESGSGYSVEVQGTNLFAVGFMYEADGRPVWYFSAGPMASPTYYSGPLLRFAGGQTLTGAYRPPGTPTVVATATIDFAAADEATLTFEGTATVAAARAVPASGFVMRSVNLRREFSPAPITYPLPPRFDGNFTQNDIEVHTTFVGTTLTIKTTVTGKVTWLESELACPTSRSGVKCRVYDMASGLLHVHVDYAETGGDPLQPLCNGTDDRDIPLAGQAKSFLNVGTNAKYALLLDIADDSLNWEMTTTCTFPSAGGQQLAGKYYVQPEVLLPANAPPPASGVIVYGVQGSQPRTTVVGDLVRSGSWSFAAVRSP